jgi:ABC-type glycerol-3-phosphate transport system substrate-binding protein
MRTSKVRGRIAAVATVLALALVAAACGGDGDDNEAAQTNQPVKLVIDTFGGGANFGYKALLDQYRQSHPNITIEQRNTVRFEDEYLPRLLQWLEAGTGAGDVVAIEEGAMGLLRSRPQYWANLADQGLDARKSEFPAWKWENGVTTDGKLFALGTDVGGMAMAYRTDLFKQAGLPTDRDEVSQLWPDWNAFFETGNRFKAKFSGANDPKFIDSPNTIFNAVLTQEAAKNGNVSYFDRNNQLIVETNPAVKTAYDYVVKVHDAGLSAALQNFTDQWATGFKKSQFATVAAPAWMLGVIEGNAGKDFKSKWDVAAVPGGGGNWGGSWLAVPAQSKHPKEAAELANFLTSKEGHVGAFKEASTFPSSLPAQQDPAVLDLKSAYFTNAPVGQIFGASVQALQPVFLGEKHATVKTDVENVVLGVDQGSIKASEGWPRIVEAAQKAAA